MDGRASATHRPTEMGSKLSKHPAVFNPLILATINDMLGDADPVLDPFAGVGGIFDLPRHPSGLLREIEGLEIEEKWANLRPKITHASALDIPWEDGYFGAIATSPTYGNRMADQYDGRDGSKRHTYRIALGQPLHEENSGALQWGVDYRVFHMRAWLEARRVLAPGGKFILNIKDHIRDGERQRVADWHVECLRGWLGFGLVERREVKSPGMRFGSNADLRIDYEEVILFVRPS